MNRLTQTPTHSRRGLLPWLSLAALLAWAAPSAQAGPTPPPTARHDALADAGLGPGSSRSTSHTATSTADLSLVAEIRDASNKVLAGPELALHQHPRMWFVVRNLGGSTSPRCEVRWVLAGREIVGVEGYEPVVYGIDVPPLPAGKRYEVSADDILREGQLYWAARLLDPEGHPLEDANPANNVCKRELFVRRTR